MMFTIFNFQCAKTPNLGYSNYRRVEWRISKISSTFSILIVRAISILHYYKNVTLFTTLFLGRLHLIPQEAPKMQYANSKLVKNVFFLSVKKFVIPILHPRRKYSII
jgi:hypothetical protein